MESGRDREPASLGTFNGHEIYPMPMFATLRVSDVSAVATWYEQALGFATVFRAPDVNGQPQLVHLRRRRYQDLLLALEPAHPGEAAAAASIALSFSADGEIDALADRARAVQPLGRSVVEGPINTPWNTRDVRVTDPAGHQLVFTGRNPNPDPEQAARVRAMLDQVRGR